MHLTARYNGEVFDDRDVKFILGEGDESDIPRGVEIALKKFKKKERSIIKLSPSYAFGSEGQAKFNIPPGANVEYELTLNNFEKVNKTKLLFQLRNYS